MLRQLNAAACRTRQPYDQTLKKTDAKNEAHGNPCASMIYETII